MAIFFLQVKEEPLKSTTMDHPSCHEGSEEISGNNSKFIAKMDLSYCILLSFNYLNNVPQII